MNKNLRLLMVLALLPIFGWGCFRVGPRVVRAPEAYPQKQVAEVQKSDSSANQDNIQKYDEVTSSTALAYLQLNGGKADVMRAGIKTEAADSMEIVSGDRIIVVSGMVDLVYPNAGMAQLEQGTDVIFLADENQQGVFMDLRLTAGKIWTRFERLLGVNEEYSVTANGVVATVRGTAFGVGVDADGVDLQVADHTVEISTEESSATSTVAQAPLKISAGEGVKIVTKGVLLKDIKLIRAAVRQLNVAERLSSGFKFGLLKISPDKLTRPTRTLRLKVPPNISPEIRLFNERLLQRAAILKSSGTFVVPLRAPLLNETAPTSVTPAIRGPRG